MSRPNFVIIGAPRSGTTSLYRYLQEHSQIYLPGNKEPHFFAFPEIKDDCYGPGDDRVLANMFIENPADYLRLFSRRKKGQISGEASTMYLYYPHVARNIYSYDPNIKVICLIRNPIDRAYSSYNHRRQSGYEPCNSFETAIKHELAGKRKNWLPIWQYLAMSNYNELLAPFLSILGNDKVKIVLFEDLIKKPEETTFSVLRFLDLDAENNALPSTNPAGIIRNKYIYQKLVKPSRLKDHLKRFVSESARKKLKDQLKKLVISGPPEIDPQTNDFLTSYFKGSIQDLEQFLETDSISWSGFR